MVSTAHSIGFQLPAASRLVRDVLVEQYGAPVWLPQHESEYETSVRQIAGRATRGCDQLLRLARLAITEARSNVRAAKNVGFDEREPGIWREAQEFLTTAIRRVREAYAALRRLVASAIALLLVDALRARVSQESATHQLRACAARAIAATLTKLHGLHHVALLSARNAREVLAVG